MNLLKICNKIIEYSFYGIFLLIPLVFTSATSELFELNKMWLTWGLTIVISTSWFVKMILQRRILLCRTPLDIPIVLFLLSQIISTIFSLDIHVSVWGYYSRFNGGLLSILTYILLYYAFVTYVSEGVTREEGKGATGPRFVKRLLSLSLTSGLIVALWGLPSHFGYDPTCLIFRGTFDVSCWTADFIPTIRIFSTLGQPDWLAAYLAILIPIAIACFLKKRGSLIINHLSLILLILFYVDLLYTGARSGVLGAWISLIFFAAAYFIVIRDKKQEIRKNLLLIPCLLLLITFIIGTPFNQIRILTHEGITSQFQKPATPATTEVQKEKEPSQPHEPGGTESGDIRLNVWAGAINAWRANPIFGTGVETFAFAYYKYKPIAHNLTSEWNFLYNKAHNEYLNFLATTGIFGLGSYITMIVVFLWLALAKKFASIREKNELLPEQNSLLVLALVSGYISILVTNFFGFSVVITNIYLFMIPAFVFVLMDIVKPSTVQSNTNKAVGIENGTSLWQWTPIFFILVTCYLLLVTLFRFWQADIAYALGYNLDRAGEYQKAYESLHKAVKLRGDEPVFKDELSVNDAIIAAGLLTQLPSDDKKEQTISVASSLIQEAISTSNEIVSKSPNNAVFWKTRTRLFHTLSQVDSRYLPRAVDSIEKASILAPNDANIWYNLGVLYGQNNNIKKGIEALEKTIKLKPDYRDAHYALGIYYHTVLMNDKAIGEMQYILDHIAPADAGALESIKNWK